MLPLFAIEPDQWQAPDSAPLNAQAAQDWQVFHHFNVNQLHRLTPGFDTTPCPERQPGGCSEGRARWRRFVTQRGRRYRGSISKPLLAWKFDSRLHWHCHFIQKLESEPSIEHQTLHPALRGLRERDPEHPNLIAWKRGQTGVPLVDACMRSLIATGWINFRMRAMLISHATFDLGLHWY